LQSYFLGFGGRLPGGGGGRSGGTGPANNGPKPASVDAQAEQACGNAPPMSSSAPNLYGLTETYAGVNAQAMFQNGGDGPWGQDVRGCLACMHGQGASMGGSHEFCYQNGFQRTTVVQGVKGISRAIWAAAVTGFSQLQFVGPPLYVIYSPFPW